MKTLPIPKILIFSRFRIFRDTFLRNEKICFFRKNIFLTQNLSRIPKIILRKPCDHFKYAKNKNTMFFHIKTTIWTLSLGDPLYSTSKTQDSSLKSGKTLSLKCCLRESLELEAEILAGVRSRSSSFKSKRFWRFLVLVSPLIIVRNNF